MKIFQSDSDLQHAKDFFVFCCFSGLRYSDAAALKKSAVHDIWFETVTQKTSQPLRIELNDYSKSVLHRYAKDGSEFALPRITLNRLNHLIKDIGEAVGIDTPVTNTQYYGTERVEDTCPKYGLLSSHAGRRTFICKALALGIPAHVVMKWTGHSDYAAMKPYIDVSDNIKAESMQRFNRIDDTERGV